MSTTKILHWLLVIVCVWYDTSSTHIRYGRARHELCTCYAPYTMALFLPLHGKQCPTYSTLAPHPLRPNLWHFDAGHNLSNSIASKPWLYRMPICHWSRELKWWLRYDSCINRGYYFSSRLDPWFTASAGPSSRHVLLWHFTHVSLTMNYCCLLHERASFNGPQVDHGHARILRTRQCIRCCLLQKERLAQRP